MTALVRRLHATLRVEDIHQVVIQDFPWLGDWRSVVTPTLELLLEESPPADLVGAGHSAC